MVNHGSAKQRSETPHKTVTDEALVDSTLADSTTLDDGAIHEKLERLVEIICGAGEEPAAALLVLTATIQNSDDPTALANTIKHVAFTRCGELNVCGMVDAQIALLDDKLCASNALQL